MLYNPPSGSTDANASYVGKNVAAGTQGSKIPPAMPEFTQREIVAAIAASGQTPTNTILVQAAMALARGVFVGPLTGSGDLAVATLGVVFPSLLQGMKLGGVATASNTTTTPKLRVMNLGSAGLYQDFPILKEDGSTPAVGDIKVGRRYRFEADGAGNVAISGGGLTSGVTSVLDSRNIVGGQAYPFYSSGTWTCPAGVTRVRAQVWGGGGGGGGAGCTNGTISGAPGAGGGEYAEGVFAVVPGTTYNVTVGAPGTAGSNAPGNGGNGGTSAFDAFISALGGPGSTGVLNTTSGTLVPGGTGGTGGTFRLPGSGGGQAQAQGSSVQNGLGGPPGFGGSPQGPNVNGPGVSGRFPGGGGTGGSSIVNGQGNPGGAGGGGFVLLFG